MAGIYMGVADKHFISALDPELDVRSIDPKVYDVWREDDFTDFLDAWGYKEPVTQPFFSSWTNNQLINKATAASVTGSGTNSVTVTTTAGTVNMVRLQQVVYLKDSTSGYVTSVTRASTGDTFTMVSDSSTLTVVANDDLFVGNLTAGERSIAPQNVVFGYTKYQNKVEIFPEVSVITDIQQSGKLEAEVNGNPSFIFKDHIDKLKRLKGTMNMAHMLGNISVSNFSDDPATATLKDPNSDSYAGGGNVQRERGLFQYVKNYGTFMQAIGGGSAGTPVPNGVVGFADMDNVHDVLIASRAPEEQLILSSSKVKISYDKWLKNLNSSGVNSVRMVVNGRDLDLTVDTFTYGNFKFTLAPMGLMNHPNVSATEAGKSAIFLPYNYRVPVYSESGVSLGEQPTLALRYQKNNSPFGDEMISEGYTGLLAPHPNGDVREWRTIWSATCAIEFKTPTFGVALKIAA